jgi:WD40 repeat protein
VVQVKTIIKKIDDHTLRIWEISTGRCLRIYTFSGVVQSVEWNPMPNLNLLLCSVEENVFVISPPETIISKEIDENTSKLFPSNDEKENIEHDIESLSKKNNKKVLLKWMFYTSSNDLMEDNTSHYRETGIYLKLVHMHKVIFENNKR